MAEKLEVVTRISYWQELEGAALDDLKANLDGSEPITDGNKTAQGLRRRYFVASFSTLERLSTLKSSRMAYRRLWTGRVIFFGYA